MPEFRLQDSEPLKRFAVFLLEHSPGEIDVRIESGGVFQSILRLKKDGFVERIPLNSAAAEKFAALGLQLDSADRVCLT